MNVENAIGEGFDEFSTQNPHEAGENDPLDIHFLKYFKDLLVEVSASAAIVTIVDCPGSDPSLSGTKKPSSLRSIGEYQGAVHRPGLLLCGVDDGAHIAASPGNQDGNARQAAGHSTRTLGP